MRKYLVEFIGTFFLVFTICMCVIGGAGSFAPLAIGSMLMVMVFAGGHISGAHYNPAVTLGVFLRGKIDKGEVLPYMISQIAGGMVGAIIAGVILVGVGKEPAAATALNVTPSILAEFLGTFALVWVVLHTATAKGTSGNSFYGLAIGFTVMACAYALGGVSGGAFNPAVAFGVCLGELQLWNDLWIYLVATFAGGAVAAFVFNYVNGRD